MRDAIYRWLADRLYPYILDRLIAREHERRAKILTLVKRVQQQQKGEE
jgi:hypothetical protein